MAKFVVVDSEGAKVRAKAELGADIVGQLKKGDPFDGEPFAENPGFVKVIAPPPSGFVPSSRVRPTEVTMAPEPIAPEEHQAFCLLVTKAAREHGPERNYLMAAAYCASKNLTDVGTATSETVGPFRIAADDWKRGVAMAAAKGITDLTDEDRYRANRQHTVAALLAADAGNRLAAALGRKPTFTELFFAQQFGDGAEQILKGDRSLKCAAAIAPLSPRTGYAKTLKDDTTTTIQAMLDGWEKALTDALTEALKVIDLMPPDIRFFRIEEMAAPWMTVALAEFGRNVSEIPGEQSNERISLYHENAHVADKRDETPWCASFVTFCMKACGVREVADSVPTNPAWAPNWDKWGEEVARGEATVGTVITWQANRNDPRTGHIGFLAEPEAKDATVIQLLGGNQGAREPGKPDTISIKPFPVANIMARRWLKIGGASPSPSPTPTPSPSPSPSPSPAPARRLTGAEFVATFNAPAKASQAANRVPALVTLAQAALESGWGEHAPGFNFFGIKAKASDPEAARQLLRTREVMADRNRAFPEVISITQRPDGRFDYIVRDWFRAFASAEAAFNAHGEFLVRNSRYANAFRVTNSAYAFAAEVARAGYATDPAYERTLASVMRTIEALGGT